MRIILQQKDQYILSPGSAVTPHQPPYAIEIFSSHSGKKSGANRWRAFATATELRRSPPRSALRNESNSLLMR
jgi:hypothetical protein